jgi:hypothetical protein
VPRFFAGFAAATALWGVFAMLYVNHMFGLGPAPTECPEVSPEVASAEAADHAANRRGKRKGGKRSVDPRTGKLSSKEITSGDDIGWDEARNVDFAGGEQQLTGAQIEAGFDGAMAKIRRCLILVPSDGEIAGKLIFGMRVGSDGVPKAVNLTGPQVVTAGESGSCLRSAAQAIRFATFQGPDMVFKYPITLQ